LIPLYWLAVSVAASKAFTQLIFKPHYWEKTHHGLHLIKQVRNQNVVKKDIKIDLLPQFKFALGRYIFPVISIGFWTSLMAMGISLTYKNSIISILIIFGCSVGYILTIYLSKVVQLIKQLSAGLKNNILVSGSLLIGSSFIANFCNFLYNAYLGRQVSAEEFGLVSLMGSLFYLTTIPTSALYRTITHRTAYLLGKNHESPKEFWKYLVNTISKISILTTVIWLVLTPYLSKVFHSNNILAFILFTPVWFVSLIGAVNAGYLNGNHKFSSLGLLTIIDSIVKLVLTWTFVSHGLTPWVYAAVPLSLIPSFAAGWLMSNRIPASTSKTITLNMVHFPKKFFATSVIVSLSTLVFLSVDVILAKTFLSPVIAGQYSLLSLAGKMVYFIGTLFSQFIIPVISKVEGKNLKSGGHFNKLFAATISSSFIGFVLIGVFGKYTVPVLFGQQALSIVPYLQWFTLSMGAFGAATAIVNYRQTQKHYVFPLIGFCFSLLHVGLILMNHSSITDFVEAAVITSLSYLLIITFIHTFFDSIKTVGLNLLDFLRLFNQLPKQSSANTQSLRILILNWYDISHKWAGGAEIYIHEIAKRWVQEGHFVTMFTGNDQTQSESQIIDGVQVVRRGGQFTVAIWAFIYYVFKFRGNFDVIVDVPKGVPFFTPLYSQTPKVCLIHQVHQDRFRTELRFPARQIALFLEAVLMPLVYRNIPFVAVSPSTKLAIQNIGLGNVGIDIVYPGVDIKKSLVKKTSYPSIVYVGRLRPYKNIDLIIHAISQIKSEFPNILLNIAGMGEDQDRLKQIVKDLNVSRHVKFLGRVSEKAKSQILTSSWIAVQPSMVEGWGITNIEANSCGTPVIAANADGLKDSVINNVTGLLISPKSSQALATAIRRLINNKSLRNKLSISAVEWAAKFNWGLSSQQLLKSVYGALNN
jgi:glycosyltransferase involved in cell wall biosynthesis/O-antigen/teichoic acid export membrane protein